MEEEKRAWNSAFNGGMGKRAWNSGFNAGLGKRAWNSRFNGGVGKRAWNSFTGGYSFSIFLAEPLSWLKLQTFLYLYSQLQKSHMKLHTLLTLTEKNWHENEAFYALKSCLNDLEIDENRLRMGKSGQRDLRMGPKGDKKGSNSIKRDQIYSKNQPWLQIQSKLIRN